MLSPKLRDILGTHGQIPATEFPAPLFITGCMRSGTTYLVNKITHHPQLLKIGSELNEVWTEIGGASCSGICEHKTAADANFQYAANMIHYFDRFVQESKSMKRHLMRMQHKYIQKLETRIRYDWDNIIPVNKSPHLMNKIGYVHGMFPTSKVVLIVRDIFAQCSSMKIHFDVDYKKSKIKNFMPDSPTLCWSRFPENNLPESYKNAPSYPGDFSLMPKMWMRLNELALKEVAELPEGAFIVVTYEDLVTKQAATMKKLFEFMNLEPQHKEWEQKIGGHTTHVINTTTKGNPLKKWEKQLSKEEIQLIEQEISQNSDRYEGILQELNRLKVKV